MNLLFFKAPWCSTCHAIEDRVPEYVQHIDCDKDQETPVKYNVASLPVFIAIDEKGVEVSRITSTNIDVIDKWYQTLKVENA
jgi:thiol-disulfide isomerase/thioredoxin